MKLGETRQVIHMLDQNQGCFKPSFAVVAAGWEKTVGLIKEQKQNSTNG